MPGRQRLGRQKLNRAIVEALGVFKKQEMASALPGRDHLKRSILHRFGDPLLTGHRVNARLTGEDECRLRGSTAITRATALKASN